jgi:hypothetical protein
MSTEENEFEFNNKNQSEPCLVGLAFFSTMNFRHPLFIMLYVLAGVMFGCFIMSRAQRYTAASPSKCVEESVAHAKSIQHTGESDNPVAQFGHYVAALSRLDAARSTADDAQIAQLTQVDAPQLRRSLLASMMALVDTGKTGLSRDEAMAVVQA